MKYYLWFTIGFGLILGWNVFLIHRDSQLFKSIERHNSEICLQLKELNEPCK